MKEIKMNKMKEWRFKHNYTLKKAAEIFNVSYPMIWKHENGYPLSDRMTYYLEHRLDEIMKEEEK